MMKLKFETMKSETVRVTAPVMHLVDKGPVGESSQRYRVVVGEEFFQYFLPKYEYDRLADEIDNSTDTA